MAVVLRAVTMQSCSFLSLPNLVVVVRYNVSSSFLTYVENIGLSRTAVAAFYVCM